jgi:hypothetical protein
MKTAESFVDEAIPHEAGHIVVGSTVGMPITGLAVNIVVTPQGKKIGDFATESVEPSDEQIPLTPPKILHAYKVYLAGGLAGNNFEGVPATEECLRNDRLKLARVGTESLEVMSEVAAPIIEENHSQFGRLTSLIRERFLALMAGDTLKTGRYNLVSEKDLNAIFGKH